MGSTHTFTDPVNTLCRSFVISFCRIATPALTMSLAVWREAHSVCHSIRVLERATSVMDKQHFQHDCSQG